MAATPSMRTTVPTPSSPLHGGRYETYHATRKTTRTTRAVRTPPRLLDDIAQKPVYSTKQKLSANRSREHLNSPPSSTQTSPRKKPKSNTHAQYASAMESNNPFRASSEDPFYNPIHNPALQQPSLNLGVNMLPTPVKTPRKKPISQAELRAGGRVLFPDRAEDPMPTPRKNRKGKRHVGFSLYSSVEDENAASENDIPIYTDSKDKVPELDPSKNNPFLEQPSEAITQPEPSKRRGNNKRKPAYGLDGNKDIEEAFKREEGMVYVFRGKKVYRKFPSEEADADEGQDAVETAKEPSTPHARPLTRSSIKPRLLFPSPAQKASRSKSDLEDEEAPTDLDDSDATDTEHEPLPEKRTPVKATFRGGLPPDTPPDTGHATRSATRKAAAADRLNSSSPVSPVKLDLNTSLRGHKLSPFDSWARTKPAGSTAAGKGTKRRAEAVEEDEDDDDNNDERFEVTSSKRAKATRAS